MVRQIAGSADYEHIVFKLRESILMIKNIIVAGKHVHVLSNLLSVARFEQTFNGL